VIDRLAVPHGLARHGVAQDHPETRQVARLFETIARQPGFRYRLGTEVGRDVTTDELERDYDAVVWATGASVDRALGIPGAELPGVVGATTLAQWSNGHPEHQDLELSVAGGRAVVIGAGNVALDMARLLTGPLVGAREVVVLGRRAPVASAFTTPELIGLAGLEEVDVVLESEPPPGGDVRARLLAELSRRTPRAGRPRIVLRFHAPVVEVLGTDRASGVRLADGSTVDADLVVGAIGHQWTPVAHDRGRVRKGVYVVGWAKRGPSGFIGTNKSCAEETVSALLDDLEAARDRRTSPGTLSLLQRSFGGEVQESPVNR